MPLALVPLRSSKSSCSSYPWVASPSSERRGVWARQSPWTHPHTGTGRDVMSERERDRDRDAEDTRLWTVIPPARRRPNQRTDCVIVSLLHQSTAASFLLSYDFSPPSLSFSPPLLLPLPSFLPPLPCGCGPPPPPPPPSPPPSSRPLKSMHESKEVLGASLLLLVPKFKLS